jgi:hypothetical protein
MGLFDTVLSVNRSGMEYNMGIPVQFARVSHAIALNEYRSFPSGGMGTWDYLTQNRGTWNRTRTHLPGDRHQGGFPLQSIGRSVNTPGGVRMEMGFIGAHADIGGGVWRYGKRTFSRCA